MSDAATRPAAASAATASPRQALLERRDRLATLAATHRQPALVDLLLEVDAALGRLDTGEWGRCTVCHDPVEGERLAAEPLVTVCLECASPEALRLLGRDLESAARVQRALLPPREAAHGDWEVAWLWEPHGPVSGDWVDLMLPRQQGEPLHLVLGDVVGKGLAASLLQSHLHALFRALAAPELSLGDLLCRANRLFREATATGSYATLVAARLEEGGRLTLGTAGHPRPLLADRRGVRPVEGGGLPLGLFLEACYGERDVHLAPGDTLLLYSDGWTEAARDEEEYGIGRAATALAGACRLPLPELLAACRDDMERFLDGGRRGDDLTLLAVRRRGDQEGSR